MIGAINCGVFVKSFNNYQFGKIQFDCETKAVFSKRSEADIRTSPLD